MLSAAARTAFHEGRRSPQTPFALNDRVEVIGGPNCGAKAAIISLEADTPEAQYMIEYGDRQLMEILPAGLLRRLT